MFEDDRKGPKPSALTRQVGGSHYKEYEIQPYEFFIRNKIPHHKAAIIRRILRYDHPTGKGLEDLNKIKHEIELIIELEGWQDEKERTERIKRNWQEAGQRIIERALKNVEESNEEEEKKCDGDCSNCGGQGLGIYEKK